MLVTNTSNIHLSEVPAWDHSGGLIVNADLEPGGTPVNKLNGLLGLDVGDCGVHILWHHVAPAQQTVNYTIGLHFKVQHISKVQ